MISTPVYKAFSTFILMFEMHYEARKILCLVSNATVGTVKNMCMPTMAATPEKGGFCPHLFRVFFSLLYILSWKKSKVSFRVIRL